VSIFLPIAGVLLVTGRMLLSIILTPSRLPNVAMVQGRHKVQYLAGKTPGTRALKLNEFILMRKAREQCRSFYR
jgi:hypothetical protein